jgi:hypothetical protein
MIESLLDSLKVGYKTQNAMFIKYQPPKDIETFGGFGIGIFR